VQRGAGGQQRGAGHAHAARGQASPPTTATSPKLPLWLACGRGALAGAALSQAVGDSASSRAGHAQVVQPDLAAGVAPVGGEQAGLEREQAQGVAPGRWGLNQMGRWPALNLREKLSNQ
jgi:hypothetical protein